MSYNILANSKTDINWLYVHSVLRVADLEFVEIFPIPKDLGFGKDALGISVPLKSLGKAKVELKEILLFLINHEFEVIDMYEGKIIGLDEVKNVLMAIS